MSKIIQKSTHVLTHIVVDTVGITSNCNTISFENYGTQRAKISIPVAGADYNYIVSGMTKVFGGLPDTLVQDVFDVDFDAVAGAGMNIVKETIEIIE